MTTELTAQAEQDNTPEVEVLLPENAHKNGSHLVATKKKHPLLDKAIVFLLTDINTFNYRFFGEFGQYIDYTESDKVPTAGVIYKKGRLMMMWNRSFLDGLNEKQVLFLFLHEIAHLLGNWHKRVEYNGLQGNYANIAHDMVINTNILEDDGLKDYVQMIEGGYVVPDSYDGEKIMEPIYEFLLNHDKKVDEERKKQEEKEKEKEEKGDQDSDEDGEKEDGQGEQPSDEDGDQEGGQGQGNGKGKNPLTNQDMPPMDKNGGVGDLPKDRKYNEYGENGQTLDIHFDPSNPIEKELLEKISKDIHEKLKARGVMSDQVERMLDGLERQPNNWLSQLKRCITGAKGLGTYSKTFKQQNRYGIEGFRGKRKNAIVFNVILDTSGSMIADIPKVLGTILRDGLQCNIVQIDTEVQSDTLISSQKDLKLINLKGFGGTVLQPAIDYIAAKKEEARPCVIMTDGYTDTLDITGIREKVIVLTTGIEPTMIGTNYKMIDCSDY
jgi:predicted metal-dependent peptidase